MKTKYLGALIIAVSSLLMALGQQAVVAETQKTNKKVVATNKDEFSKEIEPFLVKYCEDCHGEDKQKADFYLHDDRFNRRTAVRIVSRFIAGLYPHTAAALGLDTAPVSSAQPDR